MDEQQNENTENGNASTSSNYALHVAIQTMKERCQTLQNRLTLVEDENRLLRHQAGSDQPDRQKIDAAAAQGKTEVELLREKVAELSRQKSQLAEHIAMVATENRQLWSRLSKLTKDNQVLGDSINKMKCSLTTSTTQQNLIRSKTFTQNSPNPILRQKNVNAEEQQKDEDLSLEEISLKVLNEFLEGKAMVEKHCNEFLQENTANSIGFGYLNDDCTDNDSQIDSKKCLDGMIDLKKELIRQQSDLKVALSRLKQQKTFQICSSCKNRPRTADKNLETDDIAGNELKTAKSNQIVDGTVTMGTIAKIDAIHNIDFLERKRLADSMDKMCPMCGRIYTNAATFDDFQDHVESHFIDETELDISIDKNIELISHTVGDF